jgi:hypothetical protein
MSHFDYLPATLTWGGIGFWRSAVSAWFSLYVYQYKNEVLKVKATSFDEARKLYGTNRKDKRERGTLD